MKRICLLTTSFPRFPDDEASVFLQRLVEGYSECGAGGIVIVPRDKEEPHEADCAKFRVRRFRYGIFRRGALAFGAGIMPNIRRKPALILQAPMLLLQLALQAFRRRGDYDVIHANWAPALLAAWFNYLLTRKPYIVTLRGEDIPLLQKPFMKVLCRAALRKAVRIVSVNQQFVADIQAIANISSDTCVVIPNGVSVAENNPAETESFLAGRELAGKNYALFVGTLIPRKRVEVLIQALTLPGLREYVLVLCGRLEDVEYVAALRKLSADLGVTDRVKFEGPVPPSKIPLYLHGAALYLSASAFEGRPNALLEALGAGKIVAASNIPAHLEILRQGENGILFDVQNLAALDASLGSVAQSPQSGAGMKKAALESVRESRWTSCARQYINLFNIL